MTRDSTSQRLPRGAVENDYRDLGKIKEKTLGSPKAQANGKKKIVAEGYGTALRSIFADFRNVFSGFCQFATTLTGLGVRLAFSELRTHLYLAT